MAWLPQHIGSTEKARRVENQSLKQNKTKQNRVLPGSPVVKTLPSNAGDVCSNRAWWDKIPHAFRPKTQNTKQKQKCNKLDEAVENGTHQTNQQKILNS